MSSSFDADEVSRVSNDPFAENGYTGSDPQSPSHGYASYAAFSADEDDKDPIHISADASGFVAFVHEDISPTPEGYGYLSDTHLGFDSAASPFSMQNSNGSAYDEQMNAVEYLSDGPILQSPDEMHSDQGFFRREWRRQNVIVLEEKERVEKELRSEIILEAEEYKKSYHEKRKLTCQTNRAQNREKEKVLLANHEKFHANADKHYWKAIADLIPNEVPNMDKRTKKEQLNQLQDKKKPSITIHQGPKPGKPTDLSRLRHLLMKLKHDAPPHLAAFTPASTNPAPASPNPAPESSDVAAAPSKVTVAG